MYCKHPTRSLVIVPEHPEVGEWLPEAILDAAQGQSPRHWFLWMNTWLTSVYTSEMQKKVPCQERTGILDIRAKECLQDWAVQYHSEKHFLERRAGSF